MIREEWLEERSNGVSVFRPSSVPSGLVVAFSGAGTAPPGESSPTAFLARRFAGALSLDGLPIVRATQVHGERAVTVDQPPALGAVADAGECDVLATELTGVGLALQTADCVPVLLAGDRSVGAVHAGWRGSAKNVAAAGVAALAALGERPDRLRAWLGPSIGACCYEVGGEVGALFAGEFARRGCGDRFLLDLRGVVRAQLEAAGLPSENISVHSACSKCGGKQFASYRRDGARAGRMIALIARLPPRAGLGTRDSGLDT